MYRYLGPVPLFLMEFPRSGVDLCAIGTQSLNFHHKSAERQAAVRQSVYQPLGPLLSVVSVWVDLNSVVLETWAPKPRQRINRFLFPVQSNHLHMGQYGGSQSHHQLTCKVHFFFSFLFYCILNCYYVRFYSNVQNPVKQIFFSSLSEIEELPGNRNGISFPSPVSRL